MWLILTACLAVCCFWFLLDLELWPCLLLSYLSSISFLSLGLFSFSSVLVCLCRSSWFVCSCSILLAIILRSSWLLASETEFHCSCFFSRQMIFWWFLASERSTFTVWCKSPRLSLSPELSALSLDSVAFSSFKNPRSSDVSKRSLATCSLRIAAVKSLIWHTTKATLWIPRYLKHTGVERLTPLHNLREVIGVLLFLIHP